MSDTPVEVITSTRNAAVAAARSLHTRKGRTAASAFLAEGPHAAAEAVAAGVVTDLFLTPAAVTRERALTRAAAAGPAPARVHVVSDRVLAALAETEHPQGVVAVVRRDLPDLATLLSSRPPALVAVLVGVSDPGNAGTILRTADAAGADVVVLTDGSVDVGNGKLVRASAGSIVHLPVVTDISAGEALAALAGAGLLLLAADGRGSLDLDDAVRAGRLAAPTAWVFGNEAHGLPEAVASRCDASVRVPLHGRAESLNLAVAAGICLYASASAQRGTR